MASRSFSERAILAFYAEQPIHCGAETGTGYVDMPVQREKHTNFPLIPGSTIKGVLRDELDQKLTRPVDEYFGSKEDAKLPGKISFGDAFIVAFPIRSSGVPFRWVTCPQVLERLYRIRREDPPQFTIAPRAAWAATSGRILLDELAVTATAAPEIDVVATSIRSLLPSDAAFQYTRDMLRDRLVVVNDAEFGTLVDTGTEIITRIRLNDEGTTTGNGGNLFNQEIVPRDSLFVCVMREIELPDSTLRFPLDKLPRLMRVGGDETIGRGVVWVRWDELPSQAATA